MDPSLTVPNLTHATAKAAALALLAAARREADPVVASELVDLAEHLAGHG